MNRFDWIPFILVALLHLSSCNQEKKESTEASIKELPSGKQAEVTVAPLLYADFEHELVNNGKISARRPPRRAGHLPATKQVVPGKGRIGA